MDQNLLTAYITGLHMAHLQFTADAEFSEDLLVGAIDTLREWPGDIEHDHYIKVALGKLQERGVHINAAQAVATFNEFLESGFTLREAPSVNPQVEDLTARIARIEQDIQDAHKQLAATRYQLQQLEAQA